MLDFRNDLNINGNSINNARVHPIQAGDPVPAPSFGTVASYSGVTGPAYVVFGDGEGLYFHDGTNWNKILDMSDTSVTATADTVVMRDASGHVKTNAPVNPEDAVNLSYLQANVQNGVTIVGSIDPQNPGADLPQPLATSYTGGVQVGDGNLSPGPGLRAGDAFYVVNNSNTIGPTNIEVEVGDLVIYINDVAGTPTATDVIVIQNEIDAASTTTSGKARFATAAEIDTIASATAATSVVISPADIVTMFNDADFHATASSYGVAKLAPASALMTRAAATANFDMITPDNVVTMFNTINATTLDAGTVKLAETTDFATRTAASANNIDASSPAHLVLAMNNFTASTTEFGSTQLAMLSTAANRTSMIADTTKSATPEFLAEVFDNITATTTEAGTVMKYESADIASEAAIVAEDTAFITPYAAAEMLEVLQATVVHTETVSGTSGNFLVTNTDVSKVIDIQAFDTTSNSLVYLNYTTTNVGSDVQVAWTSSPAINGRISVSTTPVV